MHKDFDCIFSLFFVNIWPIVMWNKDNICIIKGIKPEKMYVTNLKLVKLDV